MLSFSWEVMPPSRCQYSTLTHFMVDHEQPKRIISKWGQFVCITLMAVVVFWTETMTIQALSNSADFQVAPATGRIHDRFGRERIFHGLNVVVKGAPWHPRVDAFDPQLSFTSVDIGLLKEWGMNVVRLGIMWPGVEPSRGNVNSTYLHIMQSIVSQLHSAEIYTLLEFHQDLYASQFCGEGLPSWILDGNNLSPLPVLQKQPQQKNHSAVEPGLNQSPTTEHRYSKLDPQRRTQHDEAHPDSSLGSSSRGASQRRHFSKRKPPNYSKLLLSKMRYPASFPEPLGRRWPWPSEWEKDGWEPSIERCNKHTWWSYYLSYAVSRAFQDLYDNKWGWGDLLARYWTVVAGAFKDQPGVLGYELMNEPWPGDVFYNPFLFLPGVADTVNLAHFYDKLQAAVRSVDRERILFFETITFDNFRCGWSTVPGGVEWQNKTVLSYHYYTPPNFSAKQAFAERSRESKKLRCGSMLTEFFVSAEQDKRDTIEFRNVRHDMLRRAAAEAVGVEQRMGADLDRLSCDPAGKGSSEGKCGWTVRPSDRVLGTIHQLRGVRGDEEALGGDNNKSRLEDLEKWLESLKNDVQTSVEEEVLESDHQSISMGVGRDDERLEEVETVLEGKQGNQFTGVEEQNMEDSREKEVDSVNAVLSAADVHVQSWIGWEYKAFFNKTGSIVKQSLFEDNGEVNLVLAKTLARTYPQSVCGHIDSFSFEPLSSLFSFSFLAENECRDGEEVAVTEIYVHRQFYYPEGLFVEVNRACASFSETDRMVLVRHTFDCVGLVIDVRISRLNPGV